MPKTAQQVRAEFVQRGETIKAWAEQKGYAVSTVRAVMSGQLAAKFGISHRIAVDLGMKDCPNTQGGTLVPRTEEAT